MKQADAKHRQNNTAFVAGQALDADPADAINSWREAAYTAELRD